jgi:hypothetical protein
MLKERCYSEIEAHFGRSGPPTAPGTPEARAD